MARGNQREKAREKNLKEQAGQVRLRVFKLYSKQEMQDIECMRTQTISHMPYCTIDAAMTRALFEIGLGSNRQTEESKQCTCLSSNPLQRHISGLLVATA
ncbi:hypothetical protein MRB53_038596 [Persea americana]|nr:hypothetical protein MRB53_038596 [Persea americana]